MKEYPVGLFPKTNFFYVLKSVWTLECQKFVLGRMKISAGNLKPVIVIDDTDKTCKCFIRNKNLTGFDERTDTYAEILCMKVNTIADYTIKKCKIQLSNKSVKQKEKEIEKLILESKT